MPKLKQIDIQVPYDKGNILVSVPENRVQSIIEPSSFEPVSLDTALVNSLEDPINASPLSDFLTENTLFIVNDGARPTPTAPILQVIDDRYRLDQLNPKFMVATGSHRAPNEKELRVIFGSILDRFKNSVHIHDARQDRLKYLGRTSYGTEIHVNQKVIDAEKIVIITSVEPHYFAGFTGGRKSILPGVCGYSTIEHNHSLYDSPQAKPLNLFQNPIHEDMIQAVSCLDADIFALNVTLNRDHRVCDIQAGDVFKSFDKAVEKAREIFSYSVTSKSDVVLTVAQSPLDITLYQAQKAIEHGKQILKDGGIILLVAACRGGIGDSTFYDLLAEYRDPDLLLEMINQDYKLGYHKAGKLAQLFKRADIWAYTKLNSEALKSINIKPVGDLQRALERALNVKSGKVSFLLDGSVTVPCL